jgi:hypothetical protein
MAGKQAGRQAGRQAGTQAESGVKTGRGRASTHEAREQFELRWAPWLPPPPISATTSGHGKLNGALGNGVQVLVGVAAKLSRTGADVVDLRAPLDNVL